MTQILLKRSSQTGHYPAATDLADGEIAINTFDGKLFFVQDNGTRTVAQILTTNSSGGASYMPIPTPITPGTAAKVSYNQYGLITSSSILTAADIPNISWGQITSSTLPNNLSGYGITDAASLTSNNFSGSQTITGSSLRLSGWSGQQNDGLLYFGSGDNYLYKNGSQFIFSITGGLSATLNASGTIYTSGSPQTTATTQTAADNSTNIATTAFVKTAVSTAVASLTASNSVVKVLRGYYCFFAQTANNKIYSWGYGNSSQLGTGDGNTDLSREIQFPSYLSSLNIIDFAVLGQSVYVLFSNNELWGWGYNGYGQLGIGNTTNQNQPVKLFTGVSKLFYAPHGYDYEYGYYASMYVQKTDNSFWCTGYNASGELGLGTSSTPNTTEQHTWVAMVPPVGKTISTLWVGTGTWKNVFCQTTDYYIYGCGNNATGALGLGNTTQTSVWANISFFNAYNTATNHVVDIKCVGNFYNGTSASCQQFTSVLTANGLLFMAGDNNYGELGNGSSSATPNSAFNQVTAGGVGSKVISQTIPSYGSIWVIFNDGTYARWGYNSEGELGNGTTTNITTPLMGLSSDPGGAIVSNIFAPMAVNNWSYIKHTYLLKPTGLYFCGYNNGGIAGLGAASVNTAVTVMTQVPINNLNISSIVLTGNYNSGSPAMTSIVSFTGSNTLYGAGNNASNYTLNSPIQTAKYMFTHILAIPGSNGSI